MKHFKFLDYGKLLYNFFHPSITKLRCIPSNRMTYNNKIVAGFEVPFKTKLLITVKYNSIQFSIVDSTVRR